MNTIQSAEQPSSPLAHIPPTFFGAVMGVSGLGLAWRQAEKILDWPSLPGDIALIIGGVMLAVVASAYLAKCLLYPAMLWRDFDHPAKGPFLGGAPLAILLQVPAVLPLHAGVAQVLFFGGAGLSLFLTFYIFSRWYLRPQEMAKMNPIWLIPGVGSLLTALIGPSFGYIELSWFFFSIGAIVWVLLSAVLMYRIMFGPGLPAPLTPSYFVLIVPPALMSLIFPLLVPGDISPFTRMIYYFALFLLLLNISMIRTFLRVKFSMGWWAYSFPLDIIGAATLIYASATNNTYLLAAGQVILIFATVLIAYILVRTLIDVACGRILIPDPPPPPAKPAD
ncbi:MAG: tellurite resistance protein [Paracoccaceae bacterium]|jgi:tellurite resistance protein